MQVNPACCAIVLICLQDSDLPRRSPKASCHRVPLSRFVASVTLRMCRTPPLTAAFDTFPLFLTVLPRLAGSTALRMCRNPPADCRVRYFTTLPDGSVTARGFCEPRMYRKYFSGRRIRYFPIFRERPAQGMQDHSISVWYVFPARSFHDARRPSRIM